MEEAISNVQSNIFTLLLYMVAVAAFSYLLILPILNKLGLNRQVSIGLSKITFIVITCIVFTKHFSV